MSGRLIAGPGGDKSPEPLDRTPSGAFVRSGSKIGGPPSRKIDLEGLDRSGLRDFRPAHLAGIDEMKRIVDDSGASNRSVIAVTARPRHSTKHRRDVGRDDHRAVIQRASAPFGLRKS